MSDTEVDTGAAVSLILVLFFSSLCMHVLCRVVRMRVEQNAIEERNGRMDGTSLLFSSRKGEVPGSSNPSRLLLPSVSFCILFSSRLRVAPNCQLSIAIRQSNCFVCTSAIVVIRRCIPSLTHPITHIHVYTLYSQ